MEPLSLSEEKNPVVGFTLELDGDPTEVQRILNAIGHEMDRIRQDNLRHEDPLYAVNPLMRWYNLGLGRLNVSGMLHLRKGI